jgi:GMP reductase
MEFIEIESIEIFEYLGEVIDLTIEDDESYNIEGIIVHNSACTTWPTTGFGSRNCQASTIVECSKYYVPIIADGGIKVPADIAKSIVLGATMVMVGGMMSGFKDSPGNLIDLNGMKKKEFWGSASQFQSNKTNRIEGTKILVEYKDKSILDEMVYLQECLQSSISYGGGNSLSSLKNVKWK